MPNTQTVRQAARTVRQPACHAAAALVHTGAALIAMAAMLAAAWLVLGAPIGALVPDIDPMSGGYAAGLLWVAGGGLLVTGMAVG